MSRLFSHPFILMQDHINRCLDLAKFYMNSKIPILEEDTEKAIILGITLHDFGKATSYFQEYMKAIMEGRNYKKPIFKGRFLTEHAFISGVYVFYISKETFKSELFSFFLYAACKRHHSNLKSFYSEAEDVIGEEDFLQKQLSAIDETTFNSFVEDLNIHQDIKGAVRLNKSKFSGELKETLKEINRFRRVFRKEKTLKDFLTFEYIFSLILDADKTEAGARHFVPKRIEEIPPKAVSLYKEKKLKRQTEIDNLREKAFKEVVSSKIDPDTKIYSITLPTGMGKTLTGFVFALKLREEIKKRKGYTPRIIYSLPFLSIIDQNEEVLREVLKTCGEVSSKLLLKHHHLSDFKYDEYDFSASRVLTEGWNSEIIITTFVQLFETLLSWRNQTSRRFNKIAGSILLIDEVQALPSKYWYLLRSLLEKISNHLDTYIILKTATQPYLLNTKELVDKDFYFSKLDRIRVNLDLESKTLEEFVSRLRIEKGKSYLFITNTVACSKELYKKLSEKVDEEICYLSTHITPCERKMRIEDIKKGRYKIAVTTQLVEAGVDIDFDIVFRDFAPLDSLSQSAGRCNRNMEREKGEFNVVYLVNNEGRAYYTYIYDSTLMDTTRYILSEKNQLSEPEFTSLVEEYFKEVWKRISKDKSKEIETAVKKFLFDGERDNSQVYVSMFRLIEEEVYKQDVFVEINEHAKEIWNKAKEIIRDLRKKNIDIFKAREEFEKLKPEFYDYVISVDVRENKPVWDEELGIYYVPSEALGMYYDNITGFKDRSAGIWIV